jgi:hypothetical protein
VTEIFKTYGISGMQMVVLATFPGDGDILDDEEISTIRLWRSTSRTENGLNREKGGRPGSKIV